MLLMGISEKSHQQEFHSSTDRWYCSSSKQSQFNSLEHLEDHTHRNPARGGWAEVGSEFNKHVCSN